MDDNQKSNLQCLCWANDIYKCLSMSYYETPHSQATQQDHFELCDKLPSPHCYQPLVYNAQRHEMYRLKTTRADVIPHGLSSRRIRSPKYRSDQRINEKSNAPGNTLAEDTARTKVRSSVDHKCYNIKSVSHTADHKKGGSYRPTAPDNPIGSKRHDHCDPGDKEDEFPEFGQWFSRGGAIAISIADRIVHDLLAITRAGMAEHDDKQKSGNATCPCDRVEGVPKAKI